MPRYRTPDAKKRLTGTYRRDRSKRRSKAGGLSAVPPAPEYLTDLARTEWHRLAPLICEQRTLAPTDLRGLEMLCETLGTVQQAQATVARDGLTIAGDGGKVRAHPGIKILETARAQAVRLLIEFGMTPRARGHVEPASDATPDNPFGRL